MNIKDITNKLKCKAELWGMVEKENELGEMDREPAKIKDIYCNILPSSYSEKSNAIDITRIEHTHKFMVRVKSLKEPKLDMHFKYNNLKFEFISWDIDYLNKEYINVFTKVIME